MVLDEIGPINAINAINTIKMTNDNVGLLQAPIFESLYERIADFGMKHGQIVAISFHRWREPTGYRDLFTVLKEHGIIDEEHLSAFQNMASFRNVLAHRYETIDDEMVFGIFKKRLDDFELFITVVVNWAERQRD